MVNAILYSLKVAFVAVLISACAALFLALIAPPDASCGEAP